MAAGQGGWLRPALGLRLLLATAFQAECLLSGPSFRQRLAESWVSPATCSAALAIFLDSLICFRWILFAEGAVRKKHNLKLKSCMQEPSLKSVDENWGGSLKSKIKYVRGSDPVLKLLDDNGNIAEELSILKWNTDSVEEFLSEKLERV
ncbi:Selenoprotein F [Apodemus speciosus]|uniref:Selenoprotein F n=1 Tax=Apodemus speciosus TaxID=105296 RepID=A0ABQ0EN11_APOSI